MTSDAKVRFMIVDDHQSIRKLCMTVGTAAGFSCVEAESAEAALVQLENDSPDIILADLMMPEPNWWRFPHDVRSLPVWLARRARLRPRRAGHMGPMRARSRK